MNGIRYEQAFTAHDVHDRRLAQMAATVGLSGDAGLPPGRGSFNAKGWGLSWRRVRQLGRHEVERGSPLGIEEWAAGRAEPEPTLGDTVGAMSSRELISAFWAAMQTNDWEMAASYLAPECVIDWPCSGERIVGRSDFAAVQARYPTGTGRWCFDVLRLVADRNTVVSEVTVTDGEQSARVVAFSDIDAEQVVHHVEYWPTAYDPLPGREGLTRPTERLP